MSGRVSEDQEVGFGNFDVMGALLPEELRRAASFHAWILDGMHVGMYRHVAISCHLKQRGEYHPTAASSRTRSAQFALDGRIPRDMAWHGRTDHSVPHKKACPLR